MFHCVEQVIGTHSGIVHVLDYLGNRIQSYRPHSASINDICIDTTSDFVGTASVDGMLRLVCRVLEDAGANRASPRTGCHPFSFHTGILCI